MQTLLTPPKTETDQLKDKAREAYQTGHSEAFYLTMLKLERKLSNQSYINFCMSLKEL